MDLIEKYLGEAIKDTDIKVGSKFELPNGETIEIKRLFKEKRNSNEPWVEFTRSSDGAKKNENSVKQLRLFLSRWKATSLKESIYEAKTPSTEMECQECGKLFKKKIGPRTMEVQCPKCKGYDTLPTSFFGRKK